MTFDYSTSGLPGNKQWENAAQRCHAWLTMHMRQFGPERIINFMHNQPVAAAKRLFETCPDYTQESITVLMLGPAKGDILEDEALAEKNFGARTVALIKTLVDPASAVDDQMRRDAGRIFIAEAISTMNDQMIGRTKPDAFHQKRWKIQVELEKEFAMLKGRDPALDALFESAVVQARAALEGVDQVLRAKKNLKPPGF